MSNCLFCNKVIGIDIEFGNPKLHIEGVDGNGFTCSKECHESYKDKIDKEKDMLSSMTDEQFEEWIKENKNLKY